MHFVLDYAGLGNNPSKRCAALRLLVTLVSHPADSVWAPASNWTPPELDDLLVHTGLKDSIEWRSGIPFVVKTWDGYVLTNSTLLVQDLCVFEQQPDASQMLHPAEYSLQVRALVSAGFRIWEETVTPDKE